MLAFFIAFNIAFIILLRLRPEMTGALAGRALVFLALFVLPLLTLSLGASHHLTVATTTEFCLSCHVMEPYGRSLTIDSAEHLPATHFQNIRVPRDQACYTCHTNYAMFGDIRAKLNGVKHVWVNYLGTIPEPLALYEPYNNRECLHCHAGARSYEAQEFHIDVLAELAAGEFSCLDCHGAMHAVDELDDLPAWPAAEGIR